MALTDTFAAGCPSGLAPAAEDILRPDPAPFVQHDKDGIGVLELSVKGAKCAGCIAKIEKGLLALPGVADARLNLSTQRLTVKFNDALMPARRITDALTGLGYDSAVFDPAKVQRGIDAEGRFLLRCMGVAAFASMNIMLLSVAVWAGFGEMGEGVRALLYGVSGLIAIPSALYAGQPFFRSAWTALKAGRANMDVPISIAVFLTIIVSLIETINRGAHAYFDGVVMLLFLLLIGRYLDHALREKARTAAKELLALQALTASRLRADGAVEAVAANAIMPGDTLLLAPGDRAPVDGVVIEGASDVDRALITGESAAIPTRIGDALPAGVINLTRRLTIRATATADKSTVAELARLIEAGEQKRSGFVRIADRAAALYVPIVHALALATFLGWLLIVGADWRVAMLNAAAVLIITCPCALGLAVPAVQVVATGRLFKRGVLVKSGDALERLAQIDRVVLDKTGTLTLGKPQLIGRPDSDDLAAAAELARVSRHPLARALVEAAGAGKPAADVREIPGEGIEGVIAGKPARLGARRFAAPEVAAGPAETSEIWFARDGAAPVRFQFADALRPDAAATIAAFEKLGLQPELLSGDARAPVAVAAAEAGLRHFRAEQSPADKIARLGDLARAGHKPLMIGDGLNDAAALAAAHASASPGTAVDATQAAADLVIQGKAMAPTLEAMDVARQARRRVHENLAFSALYNIVAVPFAMAGLVTPLIAALAMSGSSLVVTLNALRIKTGSA
jgi:P-type Cu2+ transporter